jgi:hypothetical protein
MMFTSIICVMPTTKHTNAQDMNYTAAVLGGVFILSLVWYYFPVYGGVHWFEGPVPNVDRYVGHQWVVPKAVEERRDGSVEQEQEKENIAV